MIKRKEKKLSLHQKLHHHLIKHFHRHVHKVLHIVNCAHHNIFHGLEIIVVTIITITSFSFANITGLNQDLYRSNLTEVSQHLLSAIQYPATSLKQGNIISIWNMDLDVENTFAKGYCTYGAARVSPEFFPFINDLTQQRTRGGNAVDRCKNAADTGYKIGITPSQGALIVYEAGGKFGSYGHVGKVLHYDKAINKIIVRDMARIAKGSMTDRRENLTTANVKCYIYNNKTTVPIIDPFDTPIENPNTSLPVVNTGAILTPSPVVTTGIISPVTPIPSPQEPIVVIPPIPPVLTPTTPSQEPVVIVPKNPETLIPIIPPIVSQDSINEKLSLNFEKISDIAQHFITQNDLIITLASKKPLMLGSVATLTLEIKDKKTGELYTGLLPFTFTILSTNDIIKANISTIQMINNGSIDITILGQKIGTASIVIDMDDKRIGEFSLEVK